MCIPVEPPLTFIEYMIPVNEISADHKYAISTVERVAFGVCEFSSFDYYIDWVISEGRRLPRLGDTLLEVLSETASLILNDHSSCVKQNGIHQCVKPIDIELQLYHFPIRVRPFAEFSYITVHFQNASESRLQTVRMKWRIYCREVLDKMNRQLHRPVVDAKTGHLYDGDKMYINRPPSDVEGIEYTISESTP